MAISILHLKTGEHIICKVSEVVDDQGTPVCFEIEMPSTLVYENPMDPDPLNPKINFFQWNPFSKSTSFRINFDQVVSIGEPKDSIYDTYIELIQPYYPLLSQKELVEYQERKRKTGEIK